MKLIGLIALLTSASPALAGQIVLCSAPDKKDVVISTDAKKALGKTVSCIEGDFIADMTPCAPSGLFALSAPTGSASLVAYVRRWQDYSGHTGGVVSYLGTLTAYKFDGGFNDPEHGLQDQWRFSVDRLSGSAQLVINGGSPTNYHCELRRPKV